ncbi:hypothetical protein [uncultured Abyssibacter sp.]|uniref:hypothetical protein n=1 Tax=uncultured Abyssibacter sp. TaxID=2320202 RepID=UPI0032B13ABB
MSINALINDNIATLREADALLGFLSASHYSLVGPHLRHIVDHYRCLLAGLPAGEVDYDARERCRETELSIAKARRVIGQLQAELEALSSGDDVSLTVRLATDADRPSIVSRSSLSRELQFVQGHAVHHFALIRHALDSLGTQLPDSFGKAPATLRHERASA